MARIPQLAWILIVIILIIVAVVLWKTYVHLSID